MGRDFENEEGLPFEMWENVVSKVLIGRVGQAQLAELEEALLAMPDKRLVDDFVRDGMTCAVGVYVAKKIAEREGKPIEQVIAEMQNPDDEDGYDYRYHASSTVAEAHDVGMNTNLAWHLAYLNDEQWRACTPAERFEKLLGFVQRALGRDYAPAVVRA